MGTNLYQKKASSWKQIIPEKRKFITTNCTIRKQVLENIFYQKKQVYYNKLYQKKESVWKQTIPDESKFMKTNYTKI